jgi:hypothetical protein
VVLASPYSGDVARNVEYLRACMRDCLLRGEAPFASHGLYTQDGVLKDDVPAERELGMQAGMIWFAVADALVIYTDHGISGGMAADIRWAETVGIALETRTLETRTLATKKTAATGASAGDGQADGTVGDACVSSGVRDATTVAPEGQVPPHNRGGSGTGGVP